MTRRGEAEILAIWDTKRGNTGLDQRGEENAVKERRVINQGFGFARTGGNRLCQLRSVTEPRWTGGGFPGLAAPSNCSEPALGLKTSAGYFQLAHGYTRRGRRWSLAKMQGLSSRAHAFSVEALVGKPCKRMLVMDDSSLAADAGSNTSVFTGEPDCSLEFSEHLLMF